MLRIAAFPDEISQDFDYAAMVVQEGGAEALEIRTAWCKPLSEFGSGDIQRIVSIANDRGLRVCGTATQVFKCRLDAAGTIDAHLELLRRCIGITQALGCRLLRVWTFFRLPDPIPWPMIVERFAPAIELAEREDVLLGIENEPTTNAASHDRMAEFLALADSPRVRAIWDPGNDVFADEGHVPYPNGYIALKPWLERLHVKDVKRQAEAVRTPEGRTLNYAAVRFGTGDIDYAGMFKALQQDRFDGYVALETHRRTFDGPIPSDLSPFERFSYGGEAPTRECLASMQRMIAELNVTQRTAI